MKQRSSTIEANQAFASFFKSRKRINTVALLLLWAASMNASHAQTFTLLNSNIGTLPPPLIQATDGNFYGTTEFSIIKLTTAGVEKTLATLADTDGGASPLIQATDGNL